MQDEAGIQSGGFQHVRGDSVREVAQHQAPCSARASSGLARSTASSDASNRPVTCPAASGPIRSTGTSQSSTHTPSERNRVNG
jgi:hypothetical protein